MDFHNPCEDTDVVITPIHRHSFTAIENGFDASHGVLNLSSDGSFNYTPDADFSGTDSFSYRLTDGFQLSDTATVSIAVQPVNDDPEAVADDYGVVTNDVFVVGVSTGVLANVILWSSW